MVAFNFHRKITQDSINATQIPNHCTIQCDPEQNPTTFCAQICSLICPNICHTTQPSPPPSAPPPATATFILTTPIKHRHSSLSLPLKISLVILFATLSFFLLYTLYKFYTIWYRSRRRRSPPPSPANQETHDEFLDHPIWYIRTIGLQPSVISAITVVKFSKGDGLVEGSYCSVCLSEFQENEMLRLLPKCDHAFHISCIDTWLISHPNCPLCRAGIVKNSVNSPSPEQNSNDLEETHVGVFISEEGFTGESEREEDDETSELGIGLVEEQDLNGTSEFLILRRSVSLDDFANSRLRGNNYSRSIDGDLGIELVKVDQITDSIPKERRGC